MSSVILISCLIGAGVATRMYLASTKIVYDLNQRLLSLDIGSPTVEAIAYPSAADAPKPTLPLGSTIERLKRDKVLRVGFHPDHLPYSFFNSKGKLVGLDVELMHRLASRLDARLEFIPFEYDTLVDQLNEGQFDVVIGGIMIKPERLLLAGFSQPYLETTLAIAAPDHHRQEFRNWNDISGASGLRLGATHEDVAAAARRHSPGSSIVLIKSTREFFEGEHPDLDGLIIPAEEGSSWNVLYPNHAIVVPQPIVRRPIGMAVRSSDTDWRGFLDRWIDFERQDGAIDELRAYWIEGGGTKRKEPRWSIAHDVLGWIP